MVWEDTGLMFRQLRPETNVRLRRRKDGATEDSSRKRSHIWRDTTLTPFPSESPSSGETEEAVVGAVGRNWLRRPINFVPSPYFTTWFSTFPTDLLGRRTDARLTKDRYHINAMSPWSGVGRVFTVTWGDGFSIFPPFERRVEGRGRKTFLNLL